MDVPVNLKINFRGNKESLVVYDWKRSRWESVEAMIKTSFGLSSVQVKYIDEDNEEVSINNQEEYQESLKSALKQGHQLTMNVYKIKVVNDKAVKSKGKEMKPGVRLAPPYVPKTKTMDQETQAPTPERDVVTVEEAKEATEDNVPPTWFTSYMEKFKDQVVKEAVERICREFSGQCCVHKVPHLLPKDSAGVHVPSVTSTTSAPGVASTSSACNSCQSQFSGGGYQCSVCPAYTLCEQCSRSHDPSHSLLRAGTPLSIPEYGVPGENYSFTPDFNPISARFQKRGERNFRKTEKQRLKAEKRQLKAEVKEIKKQLRMERKGLQIPTVCDGAAEQSPLFTGTTQASSPEKPSISCPSMIPNMTAVFLDENLPDGTRMKPGTKFIKFWKMRNTGSVRWTTETKLKFMWGNLTLVSRDKCKEVDVPFLPPGQEGMVSVAFVAPVMEGTYTSHWRLAHRGEQFGPRVWCSVVVDPDAEEEPVPHCSKPQEKDQSSVMKEGAFCAGSSSSLLIPLDSEREYMIPSVDLLTAQDLLSFELLDINIVQELEKVPHNTPVDLTPCMSPLPHDGAPWEKPNLGLVKEDAESAGVKHVLGEELVGKKHQVSVPAQEEGDEDISGTQFVCETVIRSLTLEEVPDHKPLLRPQQGKVRAPEFGLCKGRAVPKMERKVAPIVDMKSKKGEGILPHAFAEPLHMNPEECVESGFQTNPVEQCEEDDGDKDDVQSQGSSVSSEDYIIILPDCFDTSRPLGESMYSSAMSQPGGDAGVEHAKESDPPAASVTNMLYASQTLDALPLIPLQASCPPSQSEPNILLAESCSLDLQGKIDLPVDAVTANKLYQNEDSMEGSSSEGITDQADPDTKPQEDTRTNGGIADGLVKGALSVAASAYKALFTGQPGPVLSPVDAANQEGTMLAMLLEMGFGDRQLNQRLLRKHNYSLFDVVTELVQLNDNEWYTTRY